MLSPCPALIVQSLRLRVHITCPHDSEVLESKLPGVTAHHLYSSASGTKPSTRAADCYFAFIWADVVKWLERGGKFIRHDSPEK